MKKSSVVILLALILVGGFLVRLYRFDNPIADWHSWRQADTSAVSRNFVENGFDLLHPRFEDISNIPSGLDNPQGYRFVEFPIYNALQAGLFMLFAGFTLEEWGRLITIFSSLLTSLFLYFIVSRHGNKMIGLLTAFFFVFIPYDIYYGRTILADTSMAMAVLGGIYFFDRWLEDNSKLKDKKSKLQLKIQKYLFFLLALVFTSASFLLKPYALFFVLPMFVLVYKRFGWRFFIKWELWLFAVISLLPLIFWRIWMMQYPEGIPASAWLFNGNGIRFHPAFFRWIFYERLTKLISGYLGILVFVFGIYKIARLKEWLFFSSFLVSSLMYVCVIATGNVQHDYYQILIMPSVSIFFAIGSYFLYSRSFRKFPVGKVILTFCLISLFWFGWNQVKNYFDIDHPSITAAGDAVNQITPKNAKIIAFVHGEEGDTSLLYQTQRVGWPSFEHDILTLTQMGAGYLVIADPTEKDLQLGKSYAIIKQTPQYIIFDLHKTL